MLTKTLRSLSLVTPPARRVVDPVCGEPVDVFVAPVSVIYRGATYYFCGERCHARFSRQPARYHDDTIV